jgi:hypothetical protein
MVCVGFFLLNLLFILYNIYLFTFVFKIYLFILVPVMCSVVYFQKKREMLFLKLNKKIKSNVISIGDHTKNVFILSTG